MKVLHSFVYATQGIIAFFKAERNFKVEILLAFIAVALGFAFHISPLEWIAILFCIALVLSLEMINTAIEKLCDLINPRVHPSIKVIKDIAAGAVLVAAIISFIIGCVIFIPKMIIWFQTF